jgi:type I restriction enzyme, S subunit
VIADLQPYSEYKESGVPWLGTIPVRWDVRRMKLLLREIDSRSSTGKEQLLRVSQYTGVTQRKALDGSDAPDTRASSLVGYKRVAPDDLVINIMLAWNGSMGVSRYDGIASPAYCVYRFKGDARPWYYHELLRLPLYKGRIKTASTGVVESRLRLYSDDLGRIEAIQPPAEDQDAIVRFIDYANGRLERAIRAKRKVIALLHEQKQAIIHRAVTRGLHPTVPLKPSGIPWLGDIPKHWEVQRLGRAIRLITGFPFASGGFTHSENDVRLLRGINVTPSGVRWDAVVRWARKPGDGLDEFALQVGDIVLGMDRPIIGSGVRAATIGEKDTPSLLLQRVARLRPTDRLDAKFLLLLLRGRLFAEYIAPIFTGISVPHLSPEQIKSFKVMLPPIKEQRAIVAFTESETGGVNTAINRLEREIELLREYRTRLVADVVTGKLDVRPAARHLPAEPIEPEAAPDSDEASEEEPEEAETGDA